MKKLFYLFLTLFALVGCENIDEFDQNLSGNPEASELPQTLYASILNEEDAQDSLQTRTYLNSNKKVVWHAGDEISFFVNDTHGRYKSEGADGAAHVTFDLVSETTVNVANPPKYSLAVYPYDETITCEREGDQDKLHVTYPATQTYAGNGFAKGTHLMVSAGTIPDKADNNLQFRNACGYLVLKLYGNNTTVKSIALSSRTGNEKIAGAATIVAKSNAAPVTTMSDGAGSTITLNCGNEGVTLGTDAASATEFWFMLPPVTFEGGIKVVVTEADGSTYTKETTKAVTVARNTIKPMAAFHVGSQLYYTTNSGSQLSFTNAFDVSIKDHKYDEAKAKFVVSFHGTLTSIQKDAFKEKDITTIDIPETVTTIEEAAFYEAANLTALTIPGSVNFIGYDAFYSCTAMTKLTLKPSPTNTTLGMVYSSYVATPRSPFYASPLQSIHINRQVVELNQDGKEITDFSSVVGMFNLEEDEQLEDIVIGEQLVNIPDKMFGVPGITSITIPSTVQSIGAYTFTYAKYLNTIVFEESAEPIKIKTISKSIEALPFARCPLTSITLNREVSYLDKDGNAYTPTAANHGVFSTDSKSDYLIDGYDELECDVTIGPNVRTIHPYMFSELHVKNVTMADGVTSIGEGAFYNCDKLINITIAGTVNSIANDVFYDSDNLSSVSFLPSPTNTALNMGYQMNAFANQVGPFSDASLTQVKLNRNINYTLYEEGELDDDGEALFSGSNNSFSVEMGNQVTTIPPYMFAYSGITSVNIPVSVTAIQTNAFRDCKNLQTVVIEPSSEHIRISVQSKKDMGVWSTNGTFYQSPLRTIKLGRHIDYYSYDDETMLSPNSSSNGVFAKFSTPSDYTTEVEIGSNVDAIHNFMFYNVPMQHVTIPARVDAIGMGAFYCSTLKNVTCEGSVPPALDTDAFNSTSLDNIYIPAGSWNSYVYSGKGWSTYQTKLRDPQRSQQ
ncbi:MAG: leucine-rich repeat domain-containing protein [Bacteroidales bacterium]|nr:leucine-rich repeat domain-containing protein [Bacteroidales bacterium]